MDQPEVYKDASGMWRWRIKAENGQTVAASGEAFASHGNAQRAVERFLQPELEPNAEPEQS